MSSCGRARPPDPAKLKAEGSVDGLIQALSNEEGGDVRQEAARALVAIGAPAVVPLIRAIRAADWDLRPAISGVLRQIEEPVVEPLLFRFEPQEVTVHDFHSAGYILDIGGGGEGVIGKLKGHQVVAIDRSKGELMEAPAGPLKGIMDARNLQFLDGTFHVATSFFSLMYMNGSDHAKVFSEVFRVLVPGGRFLVWDIALPQRLDPDKEIAVVPLLVKLPNEEINAGYGTLWPEEDQDLAYYVHLAEKAGFNLVAQTEKGRTFFLELRKP
jgi:ubiquinone/menaquinone biosynthesis C-methylase UbiE